MNSLLWLLAIALVVVPVITYFGGCAILDQMEGE